MDEMKTANEALESNTGKESTVQRTKNMEETKNTCKVTKCPGEVTKSTCQISKNGNEMTESIHEPAKSNGEVNDTHVKRDDEAEEAVTKNTGEEIQTSDKVTKSSDNVKDADKITNNSNEVIEGAVAVGKAPVISDGLEQKKSLGTGPSKPSESLKKAVCKQRKEDAVESEICSGRSHTTPLVEENLEYSKERKSEEKQKMKKDMNVLEEAKVDGVGSNVVARKAMRKGPVGTEIRCEFMEADGTPSQLLEEKQVTRKFRDIEGDDDTGKDNEINSRRRVNHKRMDEKGKRRHTYSMEKDVPTKCSRRESNCSLKDFERDVTDFIRDCRRKSSYSSGYKSSSPRFNDENVSYSRDDEYDVAHYSGWHEEEGYHIQKHGSPNGDSYEDDEEDTSNQTLHEKESEYSVYWNKDESSSSWNDLRDCEEKDQYMTGDSNERKPDIEGTEDNTEGIENEPSVSRKVSITDLVTKSGVLINEDIRRKFANACVSFLKNLNHIPTHNEKSDSSMIPDDRHHRYSGRDAVPPYNQKRSYSKSRSSFKSDSDPAQTGFARYHSRTRCENLRKENFYDLYSISDADSQHGQDWSCSPEIGYNSDERYSDQNSRCSFRSRLYSSGRHHREHDVLYSPSYSQWHRHSSIGTEVVEKEEDPTVIFKQSSEEIREQCKKERDPAIRRALLSLFDAHKHECLLYLKQPDAHPDYNKEYRMFFQQKTKSILELGGNPNTFNFHLEWKKYWPSRMNDLLRENWEMKMQQCTSFISQKSNCFSSESSTDSSSSSSPSLSSSSSSSDDSSDSNVREKKHRYSKRKKIRRNSKSKAVSAKKERKQKKHWKPLKKVEEGTEDLILELDIKRYRERLESHSPDKYKHSKQVSSSFHLHDQNNQGASAIQVVDVLKLLNHMKERFGELEKPLNTLYLKALNLKENNLNSNEILEEEECCSLLEKLGEKLEKILEDKSQTVIQKVITRETHERFSHLLLKIREKKAPHMGLDIGSIARITMGKDEGETLTFIRNALLYQGHSSISNENMMSIYLKVKEEHKNIEYASNAQKLMSYKSSMFSFPDNTKGKSSPSYVEPSHLYQSQCQQHMQVPYVYTEPIISSACPDYHSSFNGPLAAPPMVPVTSKSSVPRTLKPVSILPSPPPNSRKKALSHVPSTTSVKIPPVESKEVSSLSKDHPTGLEQSSLSTSALVTSSPASPQKTDLSASQVESIPTTSEAITSVSDCEVMVDSKLYQNTIKDCFITPSSSPREDRPLASSEDYLKLDFKNPEFSFSNKFSSLLENSILDESCEIITSASKTTNTNSHESGSTLAKYEEPSTVSKKPIRITIPQLSKQKGFIPSFNPVTDDQELL